MRVLGICAFPEEFACTRYRLLQYVRPLAERGIELEVRPFFNSSEYKKFYQDTRLVSRLVSSAYPLARRTVDIFKTVRADLILIQREAVLFGPAFFESIYQLAGRVPMVLDLDDAVYIPYESERYGEFGNKLKFFGKTNELIRKADLVICGGEFVADYARDLGARTEVLPTVVDTDLFAPSVRRNETPVIGWIGTPSTFPFRIHAVSPVAPQLKVMLLLKVLLLNDAAGSLSTKILLLRVRNWQLLPKATTPLSL